MPRFVPTAEELICAVLRGERIDWPGHADDAFGADFHAQCDMHGVNALLHHQLKQQEWPAPIKQVLRKKAMQLAMWELRHQSLLASTLSSLAAIGVKPVLLKGTALAYSLYPDPALRTRADTDLLIPLEAREATHRAIQSLGYRPSLAISGDYISYQGTYAQQIDGGVHSLDLHWKINNSEVLSRLFTYDELMTRARPLPELSAHALGPSPADALLIACMHRGTHRTNPYFIGGDAHLTADRLIWLTDIDVLARNFTTEDWLMFTTLAREKGLRAICLDGLQRASHFLGTSYPPSVATALQDVGPAEPASTYLAAGKLRQQWMDISAVPGLAARLKFARELCFPGAAYMRAKYADSDASPMLWLYLRRAVGGLAKRLQRTREAA